MAWRNVLSRSVVILVGLFFYLLTGTLDGQLDVYRMYVIVSVRTISRSSTEEKNKTLFHVSAFESSSHGHCWMGMATRIIRRLSACEYSLTRCHVQFKAFSVSPQMYCIDKSVYF